MTEEILKPYQHQTEKPVTTASVSPPLLAALDLGSNSFRILIARWDNHRLTEIKRGKAIVQIARGINTNNRIQAEAIDRALACLHEFRQIIDQFGPSHVDIIATQALRQADNAGEFLISAESVLGHPVNIISPALEAEFGYLGVQHFHTQPADGLMVIDIGGASTEISIGKQQTLVFWHSLELGCVTLANQFFSHSGQSSMEQSINLSYHYCRQQMDAIKNSLQAHPWSICLGASGTMRVMADLLGLNRDIIKRADLDNLLQYCIAHQGLPASIAENIRRDVMPAGLVLLSAFFDSLQLDQLTVSPGSVKQGMMIKRLQSIENQQ